MTCDPLEVEEELKSRRIDEDERRRLEKAIGRCCFVKWGYGGYTEINGVSWFP